MEPAIHPFVAGASVAIILLSGVGIATVTGYLPGPTAQKAQHAVVVEVKAVERSARSKKRLHSADMLILSTWLAPKANWYAPK